MCFVKEVGLARLVSKILGVVPILGKFHLVQSEKSSLVRYMLKFCTDKTVLPYVPFLHQDGMTHRDTGGMKLIL